MTTKTTTTQATKSNYPFVTKGQIVARIDSDDEYVVEALGIMWGRQTEYEQETKTTRFRNRRGLMSSHAVNAGRLFEAFRTMTATAEDLAEARAMMRRYGKQLASVSRDEQLAANPDLAALAAKFGI